MVTRAALVAAIAAACHEQNRAWCLAHGDTSQTHWSDAPDWQKDSAIGGVEAALKDPRPEASHESWLRQKQAEGWTYGKEKDPVAKTHPCMVPYGDLPEEHKKKDELFVGMVQELGRVFNLIW